MPGQLGWLSSSCFKLVQAARGVPHLLKFMRQQETSYELTPRLKYFSTPHLCQVTVMSYGKFSGLSASRHMLEFFVLPGGLLPGSDMHLLLSLRLRPQESCFLLWCYLLAHALFRKNGHQGPGPQRLKSRLGAKFAVSRQRAPRSPFKKQHRTTQQYLAI